MTPASKSKKSGTTKTDKKKSSDNSKKKEKGKKTTKQTEMKEDVAPEPDMKKKRASAKAIDKTQAKRLVKPVREAGKKPRKTVRAVKIIKEARNIGIEVALPVESCNDPNCPFHGTLPVRGQIINGIVTNSKMDKTAIIQKEIKRFIPKYERYEKRTHRYAVHNPPCLNAQRGDQVKIMECRPLSKSKSFVIIEKL